MDFDFRLGLIIFFGGLWVYLLNRIRSVTTNDPTSNALLFLGFLHFVVLMYLCLGLFSFYSAGLVYLSRSTSETLVPSLVESILFGTWPVAMFALVISYISTKIDFPDSQHLFLIVFYVVAFVAAVAFYFGFLHDTPVGTSIIDAWKWLFVFFIAIPIAFMVYIIVLSSVFADIVIMTNKDFYGPIEPIHVSITPCGYVLRPHIMRISCGVFERVTSMSTEMTVTILAEKRGNASFIQVDFMPQAIPFKLRAFRPLHIISANN
jgi:hypothetical protein